MTRVALVLAFLAGVVMGGARARWRSDPATTQPSWTPSARQ